MKQKLITAIFIIIFTLFATPAVAGAAQERGGVTVTVRVRQADGSPLAGEKIMLVRPPEDDPVPPICTTDSSGECSWFVGRGLYTLHFEAVKVDPISILGPAEAGLTGLSITVGDEDITYSFAVANENHIYFDQAPDAPIPEPFIPTLEDVQHDSYQPTPEETPQPAVSESTPDPTAVVPAGGDGDAPPGSDQSSQATEQFSRQWLWSRLRFLLIVIAGCLIGFALFMWQQRRQSKRKQTAPTKANAAVDVSSSPIIHPPPAGDEFFN